MHTESKLSNQAISHKAEKGEKSLRQFKTDVVKYVKENPNNSAVKKFKVYRKSVCEWVQKGNKLLPVKWSQCRVDSGTAIELDTQTTF